MASRMMHLAAVQELEKEIGFSDADRFKLGILLPDACAGTVSTTVSHLKTKICGGKRITYRLSAFRTAYGERMRTDKLYLGYYLHLVQDLLYRHFLYTEYHFDPVAEEKRRGLYRDYALLNSYLIQKYRIREDLVIPPDLERESLFAIGPFDYERLTRDFRADFASRRDTEPDFLTPERADEYVERAVERCLREIQALEAGSALMDEREYAWASHGMEMK